MNKLNHPYDDILVVILQPLRKKTFQGIGFGGILTLLLLLTVSTTVNAQNVEITGQVTSEKKLPLPGVTVKSKHLNLTTVTGSDGLYSINAIANDTLIFNYIGFASQEIAVSSKTTVNVELQSESSTLNEVLVVGYVAQRKADITSAISVVNAADLEKTTGTTIAEKLQGRAPGVRVRTSGAPGQTAEIEIRGVNNFRGTAPLYVIDGLLTNETRDINPNDIESIQILKDAGAAALYDSRAANGVVVITTKKGESGPMKVDFDARYGIQNIAKRYDVMEVSEWSELVKTMYTNSGEAVPASAGNPPQGVNTNWQDALLKQGNVQE